MMIHPLPHSPIPRLAALVALALSVCPSCSGQPRRSPIHSPRPPQPGVPAAGNPQSVGPGDTRYRPAAGIGELRTVAAKVAAASGRKIGWKIQAGANPGPLVRISGNVDNCTIYVHPVAATKVSPNTWAFLFGHEFAHFTEKLGGHSQTSPANELKADIVGARYAMAAGYRIEAFLGWVMTEPNQNTDSHGSLHQRVQAIAKHFGIPPAVIQQETRRARQYRAAP